MPELTASTREAARRTRLSDTAMHKAERAGRIAREPDSQWDIDKTRRRLTETADPVRSPLASGAGAAGTPFARLKVAQLALKVEAQRLSLDETKRRLLDVTEANAALDEIGSTMRDALLNWPARVSGLIAAEISVDPHLLQTILQSHINDLLTEAADRFNPVGLGARRKAVRLLDDGQRGGGLAMTATEHRGNTVEETFENNHKRIFCVDCAPKFTILARHRAGMTGPANPCWSRTLDHLPSPCRRSGARLRRARRLRTA